MLYTVEDVANMMGLTDRTIRTYIKEGRLQGRKVGAQWRFTQEQVEALFTDASAVRLMADTRMQWVEDFLHKTDTPKAAQACTILDVPCTQDARLARRVARMTAYMNRQRGAEEITFFYQYNAQRQVARFILSGPPQSMCALLTIFEEDEA